VLVAPPHLFLAAALLATTARQARHRLLEVRARRGRSVWAVWQTRLRALQTLASSARLDHQTQLVSTVQLGVTVWVGQQTISLATRFWASTAQLGLL